ncbi:hypothetical protein [Phenylobacterium sp.]|uniref:hypothetical protein n=1 Tax=Phenylobacterium sp. TaxID=1871053 RepID=UPI0025E9C35A|nr:hypothetical protein [Phenylobacterium sp.]
MTTLFRAALLFRGGLAALAVLAAAGPVHAAQVCAWMTEKVGDADLHEVTLWLESDSDVDLYYMIKGEGLKSEGSRSHSPGSGTYSLRAKKPEKPWGFGATLSPPGEIDIIAELHATPADIFADDEPPLIASFTFHRALPEGEKIPPATLAERQCVTADFPRPRRP